MPLLVADAIQDAEWNSNPDIKLRMILEHLGLPATGRRRRQHEGPRNSSWMSDRLTSCGTSCQTTTREGALARLRYWCARRPGVVSARLGMFRRRVDGNPHYPSYDL
jgi:hypothetical protein